MIFWLQVVDGDIVEYGSEARTTMKFGKIFSF